MDLMSPTRPADVAMRIHRRHDIVTADGMDGVFSVAAALRESGYRVRDFSADVREGVVLSTLTCTVSLTSDEAELFMSQLQQVPSVVSVEPC